MKKDDGFMRGAHIRVLTGWQEGSEVILEWTVPEDSRGGLMQLPNGWCVGVNTIFLASEVGKKTGT